MSDTTTTPDVKVITRALAAPFDPKEVKFKPQSVKGNRALALAYIDVRAIEDRLDDVLGVENWQDEYQLLPDNSVMCKLRLRIGGRWITKADVGGPSEQPDGGDRIKAAFSDALKRAAVKFGIGRYLYRLKADWWDYDTAKRQFVGVPRLPAFALPAPAPQLPKPRPEKPAEPIKLPSTECPRPAAKGLPRDGAELLMRLEEKDNQLAAEGRCGAGALLEHVRSAGVKAGFGDDLATWNGPAIELAVAETKAFQAQLPAARPAKAVA
jgi:hypothetical protein